jgi:hypothetical protein
VKKRLASLRHMKLWRPKRILLGVIVLMGIGSGVYFFYSRANPRFLEIFLGSVLLSLLLGLMSALLEGFMEKGFRKGPWTLLIITVSLLMTLVALLVYSSNSPKSIRAEIPVIYLIDPTTRDLVSGLLGDSDAGQTCYFTASRVFQQFRKSTPRAAAAIDSVFTHPSMGEDTSFLWQMFHDFTEYLVVLYLSSTSIEGEVEREKKTLRNEAARWLAIPNPNIRGQPQPLSHMEGQFEENTFSNVDFSDIARRAQLKFWVPRDTHMTLLRKDDTRSSLLTIKNKFVQIDIEIQFLALSSRGYAFLRDWEEGMDIQDLGKPYRALRQFEARIYYDVKYDRKRYGYPKMREQEEWSQDLLSLLQRKFSWGNPPVVDPVKVLRYFDLFEKSRQNQEKRTRPNEKLKDAGKPEMN